MLALPLVGTFFGFAATPAQDQELAALHATLVALHSDGTEATTKTYGARPDLTVAKHQLRDWIEKQLDSLKDIRQVEAFSRQINAALSAVSVSDSGPDQNLSGSVGEVRFTSESGWLIITTGVGIMCQYDESVYAYKRVSERWQRIWESEQNDYSPKKYQPQHIAAVHFLQTLRDGNEGSAFVMTLGNHWGCASSWHSVYYRVWRVDAGGPRLLIDGSEIAFLRMDTYIVGSLSQDRILENAPVDVLIEFTQRSIDAGVHNRQAVRHFLIDGNQVRRVHPVALSPRDFVDEWLTRTWNESTALRKNLTRAAF